MAGVRHRCYVGQDTDPALVIHELPLGHIQTGVALMDIALEHPEHRREMSGERLVRTLEVTIVALGRQQCPNVLGGATALEQD